MVALRVCLVALEVPKTTAEVGPTPGVGERSVRTLSHRAPRLSGGPLPDGHLSSSVTADPPVELEVRKEDDVVPGPVAREGTQFYF